MNDQSPPLVSVITPVYNGEKYLAECITSVVAQTYQNWEYIITNNCSTDASLEIAQHHASKDCRIRVHNNVEFVSAEQNTQIAFGLMAPQSKYCKIVHADDWLFPDCLRQMVQVAEAHPSVGLVGAYRLDDIWVNLDGLPYPSTVVSGREICRGRLLGSLMVFGSPTSLLFRSSLIRGTKIFFDTSLFPRHADTAACYEVLRHADFGFVHQVLTFTRRPQEARATFSQKVNTYIADELFMLKKYGRVYLERIEYEQLLAQRTKEYYTFLAKSVFLRRDKQFWDYHRNSLKNFEDSFHMVKLTGASFFEATNALLCPIKTLKKIFWLVQRKRGY